MMKIFVSHSHADNIWCDSFITELNKYDASVWYDRQGLQIGAEWVASIQGELRKCNVFIVVVTPASMRSQWVMEEVNAALQLRKTIVGVMYQQADTPPFLSTRHMIQAEQKTPQEAARRVMQSLQVSLKPTSNVSSTNYREKPKNAGVHPLYCGIRAMGFGEWPRKEFYNFMIGIHYMYFIDKVDSNGYLSFIRFYPDNLNNFYKEMQRQIPQTSENVSRVAELRRHLELDGWKKRSNPSDDWYKYSYWIEDWSHSLLVREYMKYE